MKRFLSLILALIMLMGITACKKDDADTSATQGPGASSSADADAVIFKSEHYTITVAEFQYFLAKVYDGFASQYGDMINYMLDTSKPLRDQTCPLDQSGKMTWFDYVSDGTVTTVESYLLLAEEALSVGYELSEEDMAVINEELAQLDERAEKEGYSSVDDYIRDYYGAMSTKDSLNKCFTLFYLANSYRQKLYEGYTFTEEEYLVYADKNKASCYYADFMYTRMSADIAKDDTDEEKAAKWEALKQTAKNFNNAVSDKETFIEQAEKYLRSISTIVEDEDKIDYEKFYITEEILMQTAKASETVGVQYVTGAPNVDWIFAEGRLAKDKIVIEDEKDYSCEIIYMLKPAYLSDKPTVDVRHILITPKTEGDDYKASTKANEIYDRWLAGEATEESFAELVIEYSEDTGSASTGGLYPAVTPGQMVAEFNDWCFDENRKSGDSEIVKTDYGYHIMYFVKAGLPQWQATADTAMRDTAIAAALEEMKKKYSIEHTAENIDKCPDLFGE